MIQTSNSAPNSEVPIQTPNTDLVPETDKSVNAGLFTWSILLVTVGVLLLFQAAFLHLNPAVFISVIFGVLGVSLIIFAIVTPKKSSQR